MPFLVSQIMFIMVGEWAVYSLSLCRLWTPIDGEFDDYIVNPKPSGYQVISTS